MPPPTRPSFEILSATLDAQAGQVVITGYCRDPLGQLRLLLDGQPSGTQAQTGLRIEAPDLSGATGIRVGEHIKWRMAHYGPLRTDTRLAVQLVQGEETVDVPVQPELILTLDSALHLPDPDLSVNRVSPPFWVTPPTPATFRSFADMAPAAAAQKWYSAPRYAPEQAVVTVSNATISGYSAIYTPAGALLREGFRGYPYEHEFLHRLEQEARGHITPLHGNRVSLNQKRPLQYLDKEALFLGVRFLEATGCHKDLTGAQSPHKEPFGHWIFEYLPRLWGLVHIQNTDLTLLVPQDAPDYAKQQLALLGFTGHRVTHYDPTRPLRCEHLHVPTAPGCHSKFLSKQFADFLELFWLRAERSQELSDARCNIARATENKRIYVARSDVPGRRPFPPESALIEGLKQLGFRIIVPSMLDEAEKIALFANAEIVVGPMGSGLLNLAYARNAPKVVALVPDLMADRALSDIATYVPMELHYIFGKSSAETQADGWSAEWHIDVAPTLAAIEDIVYN